MSIKIKTSMILASATSCFKPALALILSVMLYGATACGLDDASTPSLPVGAATVQPAATASHTPTVQPQSSPTPIPTSTPIPSPTPAPTATPQATATSPPIPTQEPNAEQPQEIPTPVATDGAQYELPHECLADGTLTNSRLITSCSVEAMGMLRTVRIDMDFNIAALLPATLPPDAEPPSIRMQIARVFPDNFEIVVTEPEGGTTQIKLIDGASYFYDAMSDTWVKVPLAGEMADSMLMSLNMIEQQMLQDLDNPNIAWEDATLSEDSGKYIVSYTAAGVSQGMQMPPLQLLVSIDATSFLQESVSVLIPDAEGRARRFADLRYFSHDEPFTIEPPAEYVEADASMLPPSDSDVFGEQDAIPEIISLSKDGDGNVEINLSSPVTVVGEVGLYVINPSSGDGWTLPYIGGSGTNRLIFDAASPDNPPLVGGESRIVAFTLDSPESDLVDENGQPAPLYFDEWVYPE